MFTRPATCSHHPLFGTPAKGNTEEAASGVGGGVLGKSNGRKMSPAAVLEKRGLMGRWKLRARGECVKKRSLKLILPLLFIRGSRIPGD